MIEVKNISKSFEDIKAIDNITAHIEEGHVFGLIGTNGAGKSTFMRMLTGVLKPDAGQSGLQGEAVLHLRQPVLFLQRDAQGHDQTL